MSHSEPATVLPCGRCGAPVDRTAHATLSQKHYLQPRDGHYRALLMVYYACRTPGCGDGWGRSRIVEVAADDPREEARA